MRDTSLYKDINQFSPTRTPYVTDAQAVYQSVINVLRIFQNEIPFSNLGADPEEELFSLLGSGEANTLLLRISSIVEENDDRVSVDNSLSEIKLFPDENRMEIVLVFEIQGVDNEQFQIIESIQV
jgi:hypothetical protein